ncbi:MAG: hypothetical protein ACD_7C00509G0008 [uncultured bacterium]|nr:MAG: hypothetical protein ACD_7C00509G0008 [uncultured bacterium]HBR79138.1 hypothetical protein [Candidatus Moranbacteria bacterium]
MEEEKKWQEARGVLLEINQQIQKVNMDGKLLELPVELRLKVMEEYYACKTGVSINYPDGDTFLLAFGETMVKAIADITNVDDLMERYGL